MKRTVLKRSSGGQLGRTTPLRGRSPDAPSSALRASTFTGKGKPTPRRPKAVAPARGRWAWYAFRKVGDCEGCGKRGPREAHHIVIRQRFERTRPDLLWDLRNRLLLGVFCCHPDHHHPGVRDTRIARSKLKPIAFEFGREALGAGPSEIYFERRYRP